jgi:hypothetical protein
MKENSIRIIKNTILWTVCVGLLGLLIFTNTPEAMGLWGLLLFTTMGMTE